MCSEDELSFCLFRQEARTCCVFGKLKIRNGSDIMSGLVNLESQFDLHNGCSSIFLTENGRLKSMEKGKVLSFWDGFVEQACSVGHMSQYSRAV